jgi:phosphoglycolate phosphatase
MQNILHIIWDWNGTLLDDTQASVNSVNKMLSDRGLPLLSAERYREIFGFPVSGFYRQIGFVLEDEDWNAMAVEFHDLLLSDASTALHHNARETLACLQRRGLPQSVLSASKQSILDTMLQRFELNGYFSWTRGIDNLYGDSKMSVGSALMDEIALDPGNILIVGDSLHDYEVAAALGAHCVLVACGHQSRRRLAAAGVPVLNSLSELPALM